MICSMKPFWDKSQLEGDTALLYFVSNENHTTTKERKLFMDFPKTYDFWDTTENKTPLLCSLYPHSTTLIYYGTK